MPRRMRFIVFFGVVTMLVLATCISAGAAPEDEIQSTEAEIAEAQERLMDLRSEESDALADYDIALHKMNELNGEIEAAEEDLEAAEEELARAEEELEDRAAQMYKSGNVGFVDVLMGTDNFQEFATRLDLWMRMLEDEQAEVEAVREAKDELEERKSELETQRVRRVEAVDEALAHKENVTEAESEAESYVDSLNGELQSAIEAEQAREARLLREAAEQAAAERAALAEERAAEEQAAEEQAAEEQAAEEQAAEEQAAMEAAAAEAARQAEIAEERAALAEERAAERAAEEEAQEQAAIEAAAAEQARDEARAAAREAEEQAALEAEREAAREKERAAEEQAALEAEREAAREEERAAEEQAALEAEREAERQELAEERASARAEEEEESTATATATASASADGKKDKKNDSTATATATAASRSGGGGSPSCGDDFGGVGPYVAEAGCDLQDKFGLRVTGIGYSEMHWDGMDLDVWTSNVRLGNQVRDYAVANYAVEYTCWQDRYVNYVTGWEEGCAGHMDHVHITFSRYD